MNDPVADFKSVVLQLKPNALHVYHIGHLGRDTASSPTLTQIQAMTNGLGIMGRIGLRQRRVDIPAVVEGVETVVPGFEYSFKVLAPIGIVDFDTARKAYLDSLV